METNGPRDRYVTHETHLTKPAPPAPTITIRPDPAALMPVGDYMAPQRYGYRLVRGFALLDGRNRD